MVFATMASSEEFTIAADSSKPNATRQATPYRRLERLSEVIRSFLKFGPDRRPDIRVSSARFGEDLRTEL